MASATATGEFQSRTTPIPITCHYLDGAGFTVKVEFLAKSTPKTDRQKPSIFDDCTLAEMGLLPKIPSTGKPKTGLTAEKPLGKSGVIPKRWGPDARPSSAEPLVFCGYYGTILPPPPSPCPPHTTPGTRNQSVELRSPPAKTT